MRKILIIMCMLALCAVSPLVYAAGNEHGQVNKAAEPQKERDSIGPSHPERHDVQHDGDDAKV